MDGFPSFKIFLFSSCNMRLNYGSSDQMYSALIPLVDS